MAGPRTATGNQPAANTRSVYGADFVLLVLLIMVGFGVWALVERTLTFGFRDWEPNEQKIMDAHGVKKQQAELTDTRNGIAALQQSLNAARIDQLKQNTAVESFKAIYPELRDTKSSASAPAETLRSFQETKRQALVANSLVDSLEAQLASLKKKADDLDPQLEKNKEAAGKEFQSRRGWFVLSKRVGTFVVTLLIVIVLLSFVRGALWVLAKKRRMSTAEGFRPFVLALAVLVVLFAYDQFNFAGAALVGIVFLLLLLRRIEWPRKAGMVAK